jgi:hypothetical protein
MSRRILMATVAALALAAPAAAQDQVKPPAAEQEAAQQPQPTQETTGGAGAEAPQPPAMAEDQPAGDAVRPPAVAEQPAAEPGAEEAAAEEAAPPADMSFLEVQEEEQFLADEEVIGKDVRNVMDQEVGTIADLVMDQEQKLVGVVLSVGGFLGIGEKWVAIPVDQIEFPTRDQPARLLVAVTEEQLKNAPDFTTRETLEAEEEAARAQQQAMDQQQRVPSPTTGNQ